MEYAWIVAHLTESLFSFSEEAERRPEVPSEQFDSRSGMVGTQELAGDVLVRNGLPCHSVLVDMARED
ncbi:MAG: hypothetical protein ACLPY1_08805 [Terracidiphilus sp.]